jgi:hypothetical protein
MSYESRTCNNLPLFGLGQGAGTTIHGTEGTIFVNRSKCLVIPSGKNVEAQTFENDHEMAQMNVPHWKNWIECIKTREKPTSEIETCVRSSTVCLLGNLAMRHKTFLDWDEKNWTVRQDGIKPYLKARYRKPWKLEV